MAHAFQINGRRRDIGLGEVRHVSLRNTRLEAAAIKKLAASGVDPLEERRKVRVIIPTFEAAAKMAHAELVKSWKNGKHTKQWLKTALSGQRGRRREPVILSLG